MTKVFSIQEQQTKGLMEGKTTLIVELMIMQLLAVSITGTSVTYGGGGGGTGEGPPVVTSGTGGTGGGGAGSATTGSAGTVNTGGGGGGGVNLSNYGDGGNGGSGIVIVRYPNTYTITVGAGLTSSTATDGSDKVTTFTAGTDSISFS